MQYHGYQALLLETLIEETRLRPLVEVNSFFENIVHLKNNIRVYYLSPTMVKTEIWHIFRKHEPSFDLMMRCAAGFNLRVQLEGPMAVTELKESLLSAIGGLSTVDSRVVDEDAAAKIATASTLKAVLDKEAWLVFVLFASFNCGCLGAVRTAIAPPTQGK
jgi:hypothetical protein